MGIYICVYIWMEAAMENNLFPLVGGSINEHDAILGIYIYIYKYMAG